MASVQALEPPRPFYCHQCSHQWMKAQNSLFECPRCQEGFIEEVSEDFNPNILFVPSVASPLNYFLQEALNEQSDDEEQRSRNRARRNRVENNRQPSTSRSRSPHISNIVIGTGSGGRPGIVYQNHRNNFASRFLSVAIDDIMSLIFTSERQRAMTQEQLNAIPLATITSEQVEAQLQCAICFEDFQLNETEIRKLLCNHFFHEKCIFPWLRNNASCPICRTSLAPNQPDSDDDTASFIEAITNSQRARRAPNLNNEAGPSTSSGNRSAAHQPSTSSRSTRSRIPIIRPRFLNQNSNIQANSEVGTTRTRPMHLTRAARAHRALRQEENSRISSPISSRTRSQQRQESLPIERRRLLPITPPYIPSSQRVASSRQSNINNNNNNNTNSNNNNNSEEVQILTRPIRRRRNAIYLSPTSRQRSLHSNMLQNFMNNINQQVINIYESDSSESYDSAPLSPFRSSSDLLDSDE